MINGNMQEVGDKLLAVAYGKITYGGRMSGARRTGGQHGTVTRLNVEGCAKKGVIAPAVGTNQIS